MRRGGCRHVLVGVAVVVSCGQVCPGWQWSLWNAGLGMGGQGCASVGRRWQALAGVWECCGVGRGGVAGRA
jgi:hypothetical protein